jgi:hypothetical protein
MDASVGGVWQGNGYPHDISTTTDCETCLRIGSTAIAGVSPTFAEPAMSAPMSSGTSYAPSSTHERSPMPALHAFDNHPPCNLILEGQFGVVGHHDGYRRMLKNASPATQRKAEGLEMGSLGFRHLFKAHNTRFGSCRHVRQCRSR